MSSGGAPRVLALTGVAVLHAGALLFLLAETRTQSMRTPGVEPPSMLVILLQQLEPRRAPPQALERRRVRMHTAAPQVDVGSTLPNPGAEVAQPPTAVDWAAQATAAAARQTEDQGRSPRPMGVMPPPGAALVPAGPRSRGPWDYAATHRVQPLGGGLSALHVNDNCVVVLFIVIPFIGGCTLEKIPARGDLFDHMHDRDDPPNGR